MTNERRIKLLLGIRADVQKALASFDKAEKEADEFMSTESILIALKVADETIADEIARRQREVQS